MELVTALRFKAESRPGLPNGWDVARADAVRSRVLILLEANRCGDQLALAEDSAGIDKLKRSGAFPSSVNLHLRRPDSAVAAERCLQRAEEIQAALANPSTRLPKSRAGMSFTSFTIPSCHFRPISSR